MTTTDTSRIDKTIDISAPPERVFAALTTARELSAWFRVTIEGEIAEGREVWMTSTHEGYAGQRFAVRIVEIAPPRRLVWEWAPGAVDPAIDYTKEPRTTVTFVLEPSAAGTRLSVSETGFDALSLARRAKVLAENTQGWSEVLVWVRTHVEQAR